MPYSGGRVYADTSTTPHQGVSVYDVQRALELTTGDVGTLCGSAKIKKWAKNKPVRLAQIAPITDAQRKSVNYGLNVSNQTGTPNQIAISNAATWYYQRPSGGASQPFRLSDFDGYSINVACPFRIQGFNRVTTDIIPKVVQAWIDSEIGAVDPQQNVLISDIFDLTQYSGYRLTLAIVDNTDSDNPKVIRYFFSPSTLNDPNAMAGEDKMITVSTIPTSTDSSLTEYNPVDERTYTGVVMLTNRTFTQQEIADNAYRMGIYPNAMNNVTAFSLELDEGANKFQFTYSAGSDIEDDDYMRWKLWSITVNPVYEHVTLVDPNNVPLTGTPVLFTIDDFTYDYEMTASKKAEFISIYRNSYFQARVYIQGPHYIWKSTSSGPDDLTEYEYKSSSAQYNVTDWLSFDTFVPGYDPNDAPMSASLEFADSNNIMYKLTSYGQTSIGLYPIFLDADNLPTEISFQIYYRQQQSGDGQPLSTLGWSGTINDADGYIQITEYTD